MAADNDENPETPPATPPPAPQYATVDDFKKTEQMLANLGETVNTLNSNFNAVLASRGTAAAPATPPPPADISIDQIRDAFKEDESKGVQLIINSVESKVAKALQPFQVRLNELETVGLSALANHSEALARPEMPHYNKYKKEIDSYVQKLPPASRLSKDVHLMAYNVVVGQHIEDIIKETREATLRQVTEGTIPNIPTGRNQRGGEGDSTVPTVTELLGAEAQKALDSVGRTPDQYAAKWGHKNWAEYAKWYKEQESKETT